jgi:hypothetical protein
VPRKVSASHSSSGKSRCEVAIRPPALNLGLRHTDQATFTGAVNVTCSSGPYTVAVADLNGDGRPDLLVANDLSSTLAVFLTRPASGNAPLPTISVAPNALDFGSVPVNSSVDMTFFVSNVGGGVLNGTVTATGAFSVIGSGTYSLGAGQTQSITIRYTSSSTSAVTGTVSCSGGGGFSISVSAGARWGAFDWGSGRWTQQ